LRIKGFSTFFLLGIIGAKVNYLLLTTGLVTTYYRFGYKTKIVMAILILVCFVGLMETTFRNTKIKTAFQHIDIN